MIYLMTPSALICQKTKEKNTVMSVLSLCYFQVLSLRPWRSGSSWSSYHSSAAMRWARSRSQVWTGAASPTAQQTAVERSAQRTWPWCWLAQPGLTAPWPCWRSAECSWSFRRTLNWSVSCWESLRRGRGGSGCRLLNFNKHKCYQTVIHIGFYL